MLNAKVKKNKQKGELHIAIPLSLFALGTLIIIGSLYFILQPYFEMKSLLLASSSAAAQSARSSKNESARSSSAIPSIVYSEYGKNMGSLTIKNASIVNYPVLHGDGNEQLRNGIGHFTGSDYPGEGGKIVLDAHRETFFKNLKYVSIGNEVVFSTHYGKYIYRVTGIKILSDTDKSIIEPDTSHEYLVMYTCYPFDTIGYHPQRYVVSAKLVSGTKVKIPKW